MQWKTVCGKTGAIETQYALIPVYRLSEQDLILIDSGAEESPELLKELEQRGLSIRAVLCTHLHPDHIANNSVLVSRYDAEIYASSEEISAAHTQVGQYGKDRLNRRGLNQVPDYPIIPVESGAALEIDGVQFEVLATPGHTSGHLAYATPDGVCCVGDAIMSKQYIQHTKMPFMDDIDRGLESMEALRQTQYPYYVAAHSGVIELADMSQLLDDNIKKELDLYHLLRQQITKATEVDQVIKDFLIAAGVVRQDLLRSRIVQFSARTRLKALVNAGEFSIQNKMVVPRKKTSMGKSIKVSVKPNSV